MRATIQWFVDVLQIASPMLKGTLKHVHFGTLAGAAFSYRFRGRRSTFARSGDR